SGAVLAQGAQLAVEDQPAAVALQVRPAGAAGQGVGAALPQVAVVDDGLDGDPVGAGDAGAEADHRVVHAEPGLAGLKSGTEALEVLAHGRVLAVGGAADPAHIGLGRAPLAAGPVGQALGGHGGAGQPVPVDGGPEPVRVLVAAARCPPQQHSGAGVPAARVLAVAALVVGDAVAGHGDVRGEAGAAVHGP